MLCTALCIYLFVYFLGYEYDLCLSNYMKLLMLVLFYVLIKLRLLTFLCSPSLYCHKGAVGTLINKLINCVMFFCIVRAIINCSTLLVVFTIVDITVECIDGVPCSQLIVPLDCEMTFTFFAKCSLSSVSIIDVRILAYCLFIVFMLKATSSDTLNN